MRNRLLSRLSEIFRDHQPEHTAERRLATNLLADYVSDQPQLLADLLMDADEKQFPVIYPRFEEQGERGLSFLPARSTRTAPRDDRIGRFDFTNGRKWGRTISLPTGKRSSNRRFSMNCGCPV